MRTRISIVLAMLLLSCACGSDDPPSNNAGNENSANNTNNANNANNANNQNTNNANTLNNVDCISAQNDVASAIRGLPRECINNSDCIIVERAANCECSNAVSFRSDLAEFEEALGRLDSGNCGHPFACAQQSCSYESGLSPSELVPVCGLDSTCEVREALTCEAFEAGAKGGLVTSGACTSDEDCVLRDDLNPCGCAEGVTNQFPVLVAQAIYDMMELNTPRCEFTCDACPVVSEARCIESVCTEM